MIRVNPPFRGEPRAQCDRCGKVLHLSDMRKDGQTRGGLMVCERCYDPIHPQEFIRAKPDPQAVPNARHVTTAEEAHFLTPGEVTRESL